MSRKLQDNSITCRTHTFIQRPLVLLTPYLQNRLRVKFFDKAKDCQSDPLKIFPQKTIYKEEKVFTSDV